MYDKFGGVRQARAILVRKVAGLGFGWRGFEREKGSVASGGREATEIVYQVDV